MAVNLISFSERDIYALIERFDKTTDGRIAYHEFLNELTSSLLFFILTTSSILKFNQA